VSTFAVADPYTKTEQDLFGKCDVECAGEEHHREGTAGQHVSKSFCELPMFHEPLDPRRPPPNGGLGYVSADGHHFLCARPGVGYHIIFVLDRSGSMMSNDMRPLMNTPVEALLRNRHNNRLGAVYNAVHQFITVRKGAVQGGECLDTISLILFNHSSEVIFANSNLGSFDNYLAMMLQHEPDGGTNFRVALDDAGRLLQQHHDPSKTNVVLFLSDGECSIADRTVEKFCVNSKNLGSPVFLFTILFSNSISSRSSLERMAEIAASHHEPRASGSELKCGFYRALDEVRLADHFVAVAKSMREHKPAMLMRRDDTAPKGRIGRLGFI